MFSFLETNIKADYSKLAYDYKFNDIDGNDLNLNKFKNQVIVVVNVASQCGFTKQYEDMQKVWVKYQDKGEPGSARMIPLSRFPLQTIVENDL